MPDDFIWVPRTYATANSASVTCVRLRKDFPDIEWEFRANKVYGRKK